MKSSRVERPNTGARYRNHTETLGCGPSLWLYADDLAGDIGLYPGVVKAQLLADVVSGQVARFDRRSRHDGTAVRSAVEDITYIHVGLVTHGV